MAKKPSEPRKKQVNVKIIPATDDEGRMSAPHKLMRDLIDKHHTHLRDARIAMAWRYGWKPDPDNRVKLGQCKKGSDLDRELHPYDFVILVNAEWWSMKGVKQEHRRALIDHELCHAQVDVDRNGQPKEDERGRTIYRIRKHDIEEFSEIVARHGCYTHDL